MDTSPRFGLPLIMASQAQKHLTHNESLMLLEALVQPVVDDVAANSEPLSPSTAMCVIVAAGASGIFAGEDHKLAVYVADAWHFFTPQTGWSVTSAQDQSLLVYDGAIWVTRSASAAPQSATLLGINTQASTTNRLSVASDATVLTAEHDDHRLTINKTATPATASVIFQSGWSGRTEMGLVGDDQFAIKVSTDGSTWLQALHIDPQTGRVTTPAKPLAHVPFAGGTQSFLAGQTTGLATPSFAQGGIVLDVPVDAPLAGHWLHVPADGTYQITLCLHVTLLGGYSLVRNQSDVVASFLGTVSGPARSVQVTQLIQLNKDDTLALRFDDPATVASANSWLDLVYL